MYTVYICPVNIDYKSDDEKMNDIARVQVCNSLSLALRFVRSLREGTIQLDPTNQATERPNNQATINVAKRHPYPPTRKHP